MDTTDTESLAPAAPAEPAQRCRENERARGGRSRLVERLGWAHPTMLAPMEGVTHPTFRHLIARWPGVGVVCTEFVRIGRNPIREERLRDAVVKSPGVPLSVQVMGTEVDRMADAAACVARAGADIVDINLGCPSPRVVRKGAGSAMLKDLDLLFEVLSAMREQVPGPLSAKIRAGFDRADRAIAIGKTVERAGADFIIVHPRRRADFYEGVADWRIVKELRDALTIPVVGNGDVWYAADALRMRAETGCDAVMIGRPALRNPWIFQQIEALERGATPPHPSGEEVVGFLHEVAGIYREEFAYLKYGAIGKIKELIRYLGRAVPDDRRFMRAALRRQTIDEILALADQEVAPRCPEELDLAPESTHGLERSGSALEDDSPVRAARGA